MAAGKAISRRVVLGFVLAPLPVVGPIPLLEAILLVGMPEDGANLASDMMLMVFGGYGVCLLLGIPIHLILARKGRSDLASYLLAVVAAVFAAACMAALLELRFRPSLERNPFGWSMWSRFGISATVIAAVLSCACASIFWKVAVARPRR